MTDNLNKTVYIGCDHAGVWFKNEIISWLGANGYNVTDCGCGFNEAADYPDVANAVCSKLLMDSGSRGILICGTGVGISMAANKINGIRAAHCHDHFCAKYTRLHNDANVLCMGARVIGTGLACELAQLFLETEFEGGRHINRVDKIMLLEGK